MRASVRPATWDSCGFGFSFSLRLCHHRSLQSSILLLRHSSCLWPRPFWRLLADWARAFGLFCISPSRDCVIKCILIWLNVQLKPKHAQFLVHLVSWQRHNASQYAEGAAAGSWIDRSLSLSHTLYVSYSRTVLPTYDNTNQFLAEKCENKKPTNNFKNKA